MPWGFDVSGHRSGFWADVWVTGQIVCLLVACCVVLGFVSACPAFFD